METKQHICPVWIGYLLTSPLRKVFENPSALLSYYVLPGMKILEIGPAMGFFSIPLAKMTGKYGKVYCVDIQEKMLDKLRNRAIKKGVINEIELILSNGNSLNIEHLSDKIDFTLLAHVVHEVPDQKLLFQQINRAMKSDAKVLLIEPKGHVTHNNWNKTLKTASECGFTLHQSPHLKRGWIMELIKQ